MHFQDNKGKVYQCLVYGTFHSRDEMSSASILSPSLFTTNSFITVLFCMYAKLPQCSVAVYLEVVT